MIKQIASKIVLVSILLLSGCAFFQSSYPAQTDATEAMKTAVATDYGWAFLPDLGERRAQLIFYPGGKVQPQAYAALLQGLANSGLEVALVKFPLDLAVLNSKAAEKLLDDSLPTFIAGHSLGGAMAANFSRNNLDRIDGLILLAAYSLESYGLHRADLPVLSIYASHDLVATQEDIERRNEWLPPTTQFLLIKGGNHAQFGDYGDQKGDGIATITALEQRQQTIDAIQKFIESVLGP